MYIIFSAEVRIKTCVINDCGPNAKCVDRSTGYQCICNIGYEKSGPNFQCQGKSYCITTFHNRTTNL